MMKKWKLRKVRKRSKELSTYCRLTSAAIFLSLHVFSTNLEAVLFFATDDPEHNTTPPTDEAEARAWHLQGIWRTCQGTPIAPRWFLSAKHIGGAIGDAFTIQGKTHYAIARILDPESDLVLWGVTDSFQDHAALFSDDDEIGLRMLVFGRGAVRGNPVFLETGKSHELKGWERGSGQAVMRWGENIVTQIADDPILIQKGLGQLIGAEFNRNGLPDEAGLSPCDSGGGMFLWQENKWKLAAISYGAGGKYNTHQEGEGFIAMLFDGGGFYVYTNEDCEGEGTWEFIEDNEVDQPSSIWGTRIQYRSSWIEENIAAMPNPETSIVLESAQDPTGPFGREPNFILQQDPLALTIEAPTNSRFYRITATDRVILQTPILSDGKLLLPFSGR
jgi:hypothetical protein